MIGVRITMDVSCFLNSLISLFFRKWWPFCKSPIYSHVIPLSESLLQVNPPFAHMWSPYQKGYCKLIPHLLTCDPLYSQKVYLKSIPHLLTCDPMIRKFIASKSRICSHVIPFSSTLTCLQSLHFFIAYCSRRFDDQIIYYVKTVKETLYEAKHTCRWPWLATKVVNRGNGVGTGQRG